MKHIVGYSILCILCIGVFLIPFWAQITLFVFGVFFLRYKFLLLIPALLADVLYMPQGELLLPWTVLTVLALLLLVALINKTTRLTI